MSQDQELKVAYVGDKIPAGATPRYITPDGGVAYEPPHPTIEELKASPVLFVETFGWHPEPGYVPPWQKKILEKLSGPMGRV